MQEARSIKREELMQRTVKQLLVAAKGLKIVGRHNMRKVELVDAIIDRIAVIEEVNECDSIKKEEKEKRSNTMKYEREVKCNWGNNKRPKSSYIDNAKIGFIVAFKVGKRTFSGKIIEINTDGFVIETKNGVKFNIRKENIVWVKTGKRWPKGVFLALKGVVNNGEK